MKLITKYRKYTIRILIGVALISLIVLYFLFRYSIHSTTDDVLNEYRINIENYAADHDTLRVKDLPKQLKNIQISRVPIDSLKNVNETIRDTFIFSHYENELIVYRKLAFPIASNGRGYVVNLMLPSLEEHDLITTVILSILFVVLLFIFFLIITDWTFNKNIYQPLNKLLEDIRSYNIESPVSSEPYEYDIDEFQELNSKLKSMMRQNNIEYQDIKNFIENISHELQTPLSVIRLKLEALNQLDIDNEEVLKNIVSINHVIDRIIRFNRSILFIAKINNNQYNDSESLNLNDQITQFLHMYEEILSIRDIKLNYNCHEEFIVDIHIILAEQLVQNILTNAVKHNYNGGIIDIETTSTCFKVSNTFSGSHPDGCLFDRYKRTFDNINSNGLGLSIVKNICDKNQLSISYEINNHIFTIVINK